MNSVDFFELWITAIGNVQADQAECDGVETIKFQSPRIYQKLLLKQGVPIAFSWRLAMWDGAGLIRARNRCRDLPWKDFIKKPQAKVLPIVRESI